ncbi:urease accessory protein UreE [Rhodoplanes sp. SY1]|uniref:urease accessory protein UreE n=1 Tax=Rhodoplanes sp. SY1 TaxID=3166646 RepID=UPI0038B64FBD
MAFPDGYGWRGNRERLPGASDENSRTSQERLSRCPIDGRSGENADLAGGFGMKSGTKAAEREIAEHETAEREASEREDGMLRATKVLPHGTASSEAVVDRVLLDADDRHRRRLAMTGEAGTAFLLDLPEATRLLHGDGLLLEDGRVVLVAARPEALIEVAAASAAALARLAWHIGNRHTEVQIVGDRLRIRRDHVLEDMLRGLGATLTPIDAAFDPESGAYAPGGHGHSHGHGHGHGHAHAHAHGHARHDHDHDHHDLDHAHGHDHHGHDHDHAHHPGHGHPHPHD